LLSEGKLPSRRNQPPDGGNESALQNILSDVDNLVRDN